MSPVGIVETERGFSVRGEMSLATVDELLAASRAIDFSARALFEIDLSEVQRADSAGLALLIEWLIRARRSKTDLRFLQTPEQLREIARVTEVDALLPGCE